MAITSYNLRASRTELIPVKKYIFHGRAMRREHCFQDMAYRPTQPRSPSRWSAIDPMPTARQVLASRANAPASPLPASPRPETGSGYPTAPTRLKPLTATIFGARGMRDSFQGVRGKP